MRGVSRNLNKNHEQKLEVWPFIHFQWCIGIGTIGESLQSIPTRIFRISARLLRVLEPWWLDYTGRIYPQSPVPKWLTSCLTIIIHPLGGGNSKYFLFSPGFFWWDNPIWRAYVFQMGWRTNHHPPYRHGRSSLPPKIAQELLLFRRLDLSPGQRLASFFRGVMALD